MSKVVTINGRLFCDEQDHDGFSMKCGAPIPCPYHTPILDIDDPNLAAQVKFIADKKRKAKSR
jgi:hypothetical protein